MITKRQRAINRYVTSWSEWRKAYRNRHGHDPPPRLIELKRRNRASVKKRKQVATNATEPTR